MLLLLLMTVFCLSTSTAFATASSSSIPTPVAKKGIIEKFKAKVATIAMNKILKKEAGDFSIPGSAKTWLVYWILGALATIVLAFVLPSGLYLLWRLLSVFTSIAFIIWILKLLGLV